jgi:glutathione S-transferase
MSTLASERAPYRVYGMTQSYFTRKLTGYLDYKGIPYLLRRFAGAYPAARAAGWPSGIPVVMTPGGEFMWDTTSMIHHLELGYPERAVLPADHALAFICYALEDARSTSGSIAPRSVRAGSSKKTPSLVDGSWPVTSRTRHTFPARMRSKW